jgi:hypothetical protein
MIYCSQDKMSRPVLSEYQSPADFLKAFRKRTLLRSALQLTFLATMINEAIRWLAVGARTWPGITLPVINTGPIFFLIALALTFRRWSPAQAAARADGLLDFQDRLTSFVDFARRADIPAPMVRAQAGEAAAALKGISPKQARPIHPMFYAGPLLFALSLYYPYLIPSGPVMFRVARHTIERSSFQEAGTDGGAAPREKEDSPAHHPQPDIPLLPAPADAPDPPVTKPAPPLPGLEASRKEDDLPPRKPAAPPKSEIDETSPLVSQRRGDRLSRVVDPVYSAVGDEPPEKPELPGGSMVFRLLPETAGGGGINGENMAGERGPVKVVVDFATLPVEYRVIVESYFTLLGDEDSTEGRQVNSSPGQPARKELTGE